MAESTGLFSTPSIFTTTKKPPHPCLSIAPRPTKIHFSQYISSQLLSSNLNKTTHLCPITAFIALTSDCSQLEENTTSTITTEETALKNQEIVETEVDSLDSEPTIIEASESQGESSEDGGVFEEEKMVVCFAEPPEEVKLFVGNSPYDVDSEKLAVLFE